MKAIRVTTYGGPEVMRLEEVPDPIPEMDQVVIKVQAAGVNPIDTYYRAGTIYKHNLPFTPGSDASGIIESIGPNVTSFSSGDRVYVNGSLSGTYAEKTLCHVRNVHLLPDNIEVKTGAAIGITYATAACALLFHAKALPGESVLVHGATGGVGTASVQIARSLGLTVIGTGSTKEGREMVIEQGANYAVNHFSDGYLDEIMKFTKMRGVSIILEMLANVNLAHDTQVLAHRGRIVVIGNRGKIEIDPRELMKRDGTIVGMLLTNAQENEILSAHAFIKAGLENGTLRPIIGKEFSLKDAGESHHFIMENAAYGKIILLP